MLSAQLVLNWKDVCMHAHTWMNSAPFLIEKSGHGYQDELVIIYSVVDKDIQNIVWREITLLEIQILL